MTWLRSYLSKLSEAADEMDREQKTMYAFFGAVFAPLLWPVANFIRRLPL